MRANVRKFGTSAPSQNPRKEKLKDEAAAEAAAAAAGKKK